MDEIPISDLVYKICNIINFSGILKYDTQFSDGQLKKTASDKELKKYLPNFKFTSLDQGLKETINFFISNYSFFSLMTFSNPITNISTR